MKSSGIGGQAVIEGIMMKNKDVYSIAVRRPDGEIDVHLSTYDSVAGKGKLRKIPILRGVINFVDSLVLGMRCLTHSAKFYDDEDMESSRADDLIQKIFKDKAESVVMGLTVTFSIVMAVAIFMILPYFVADYLKAYIVSDTVLAVVEGAIRLFLFVIYVLLISRMKDIQRVFQYHGAEHKCINCIENGWELNTKNVRKASKHHKRCGTSFMLVVMVISIIFFIFIRVDSPILRVLLRIALVPVIAGVSYEFIRFAGNTDNFLICILSRPGMWLQALTTREPDRKMMEVGIAAVEAVFDWRAYQAEQGIVHESLDDELELYGENFTPESLEGEGTETESEGKRVSAVRETSGVSGRNLNYGRSGAYKDIITEVDLESFEDTAERADWTNQEASAKADKEPWKEASVEAEEEPWKEASVEAEEEPWREASVEVEEETWEETPVEAKEEAWEESQIPQEEFRDTKTEWNADSETRDEAETDVETKGKASEEGKTKDKPGKQSRKAPEEEEDQEIPVVQEWKTEKVRDFPRRGSGGTKVPGTGKKGTKPARKRKTEEIPSDIVDILEESKKP
ncbi:MAG: DUF1385 domain-containing protein [Lachnospiraceae bacterium]|nr:DUF1385 domain-containing protein [Lachnospiraceae bacterium]